MPEARFDDGRAWLESLLQREQGCAYLAACGHPPTLEAFRAQVPPATYDQLEQAWWPRLVAGEADVLFRGRPVAYERTGGSTGGPKLIPYSLQGLAQFQQALVPWLATSVRQWNIQGRVYLATSPATRTPMQVRGVPVGLPDGAYLGEEWGAWVAERSAVPLSLMQERDVGTWHARTVAAVADCPDLEMISVWSPTFLLRLLDDLPDPRRLWPRLRLVSCWASAGSARYADDVRRRIPHAHLQPKGLLSTECVATVPDGHDRPVLTGNGFFEFDGGGGPQLASELTPGAEYELIATTASGLYRYRTGDVVRCDGVADGGRPVLAFCGRSGGSDLVGEKLSDAFVGGVLAGAGAFCFLSPSPAAPGYVLVADADAALDVRSVERALCANPQYDYARGLGQLQPLQVLRVPRLHDQFIHHHLARGVRLGDIKPPSLVADLSWLMPGTTR